MSEEAVADWTLEEQAAHRGILVKALRSGYYHQITRRLRDESLGDKFMCCLGVACDVSGLGEWNKNVYEVLDSSTILAYREFGLPSPVQDWLGANGSNWVLPIPIVEGITSLAAANDYGTPFSQIADAIEMQCGTDVHPKEEGVKP